MAAWNNSTFNHAEACLRLYYLSAIARLSYIRQEALPGFTDRDEGLLWHAVMAQHYGIGLMGFTGHSLGPLGPVYDVFSERIGAATFDEDVQALKERLKWWERLYEAYAKRYVDEDVAWEVLAVEQRFVTVLGEQCPRCFSPYTDGMRKGIELVPVCACGAEIDYLVGQADLIIRENGVLKVIDHKTTRRSVGEWKLASYTEDSQFTHYLYGISRVTGEWVGAGTANVAAKLKLVDERGNPFHRNSEIIRGPADFDAFVAERRDMIGMLRTRRRMDQTLPGTWPRSPSACRRFGLCEFYGVCWPTRAAWAALPDDLVESYERKPLNYVDDYALLIEEDVR